MTTTEGLTMTTSEEVTDPLDSYRPALIKLSNDLESLERELMAGFEGRDEVLSWMQRLSVRTLGEIPQRWFSEMARQFRGVPESGKERVLMSALLVPVQRERDLDEEQVAELRRRLIALTIRPAGHRAFRALRKDATEYIDASADSQHTPARQRFVAMRPALDELEDHQERALEAVIDGFDEPEHILEWGHDVDLATHGEIPASFVTRCYWESSTRELLVSDGDDNKAARELLAAHHLAPYFNRGVRDLAGRAGEKPDAEQKDRTIEYI